MVGAGYTSRQEGQERHPRDGGSIGALTCCEIRTCDEWKVRRCWWAASRGVERGIRGALQGSSAEVRRGQRAKAILFLVLVLRMGLFMVRLWEGGGVVVCVLVVGVVGDVGGGWSRVVGVVGLEVGGGMLEVRGVVIPTGELRSPEILMAGD